MMERGNKRIIKGVVVSNKMDKTIVVRAERLVKHSVFHKYIFQTTTATYDGTVGISCDDEFCAEKYCTH